MSGSGPEAECEERLRSYIASRSVPCKLMVFETSTHSVEEAVEAINRRTAAAPMTTDAGAGEGPGGHHEVFREDFVKSICLIAPSGELIVAVVKGEDRASAKQVAKALSIEPPRLARPDEMLERTGYPAGGTPPFGFEARWLIDPRVMEKEEVIGGGGSPRALVRISTVELQRANGARVVRVRK